MPLMHQMLLLHPKLLSLQETVLLKATAEENKARFIPPTILSQAPLPGAAASLHCPEHVISKCTGLIFSLRLRLFLEP